MEDTELMVDVRALLVEDSWEAAVDWLETIALLSDDCTLVTVCNKVVFKLVVRKNMVLCSAAMEVLRAD